MIIGTSQIDITPEVGTEMTGFADRVQPSTGVLDPLYCRALYLKDGGQCVLWLSADLLAFERDVVEEFRDWAIRELGLAPSCVMVSATHTHSGPATVHLTGCGQYEADYIAWLLDRMQQVARLAMANTENCELVSAEGKFELGIHRRGPTSAHTDPQVGAIAWRREDGTFKAVVLNYAMHAVCLTGREFSADYPGQAAITLSRQLPGEPMVMVCVGASGNINPPAVGVSYEQMKDWGRSLAESIVDKLLNARGDSHQKNFALRVATKIVPLPLDVMSVEQINDYADRMLDSMGKSDNCRLAIETWRESMTKYVQSSHDGCVDVELFCLSIGDITLIGVNAEIFSQFTGIIRSRTGRKVYTVSFANGVIGYVPSEGAYDDGGYEVEHAFLFYNGFRPKRGGLEFLADCACELILS